MRKQYLTTTIADSYTDYSKHRDTISQALLAKRLTVQRKKIHFLNPTINCGVFIYRCKFLKI